MLEDALLYMNQVCTRGANSCFAVELAAVPITAVVISCVTSTLTALQVKHEFLDKQLFSNFNVFLPSGFEIEVSDAEQALPSSDCLTTRRKPVAKKAKISK
jgi:hypothetical protein